MLLTEIINQSLNMRTIDTTTEDIALFEARKKCKSIKDSMEIYENRQLHETIPENRPFIVRLNGNSFTRMNIYVNSDRSKQEINKSYSLAIINTARCLLNDIMFKPRMVYVVDDEIILLFHKADIFKRSTQKYLTLLSSKATSYFRNCFANYMPTENIQNYEPEIISKMKACVPVFEGRIVYFPEDKSYEIVNYLIWRSTQRNSLQEYTRTIIGKSQILKKNNDKLTAFVEDYVNENVDKILPDYTKFGVFMKRTLYSACYVTSESIEKDKIEDDNVTYPIDCLWSMKFKYSNEILEEMLAKYYDQDKWNSISKNSTTTIWKNYCIDTFDCDTHSSGETTYSEDEDFKNHLVTNGDISKYDSNQNKEKINILYTCIPGMTIAMLFIHCFQLLNKTPLARQIYDLTLLGFLHSTIVKQITNKSGYFTIVVQLFWAFLLICVNIPSLFKSMLSSDNATLVSLLTVVYGFYITVFLGIYMFEHAINKKANENKCVIIYKKHRIETDYESSDDEQTVSGSLSSSQNKERLDSSVSSVSSKSETSVPSSKKDD